MTLTCPYCREAVNPSNQILCDVCQTPHHSDCWKENGGCTVFGCARSPKDEAKITVSQNDLNSSNEKKYFLNIKETQSGPFSQNEISNMLKEGRVNNTDFVWGPELTEWSTLEKLSYKFSSKQSDNSATNGVKNLETDLIKIFVKTNYSYYQSKWMDPNKIGYNYAGFWLNVWWLAYRKMYAEWAVVSLGYIFFFWLPFGALAISYFVGKQGNSWYLVHCKNKVEKICPDGSLNDYRKQKLEKQGGCSLIAAIGLNLISFLIIRAVYTAIHSK